MKLYHGTPKKLKILKPQKGRLGIKLAKKLKKQGLNIDIKFETQRAIFLTKKFKHAALHCFKKTLNGRTLTAVTPKNLIIVGNHKPGSGYVYEVNIKAKKGPSNQYAYDKEIKKFKIKKVYPGDYQKNIIYVKTKIELLQKLK